MDEIMAYIENQLMTNEDEEHGIIIDQYSTNGENTIEVRQIGNENIIKLDDLIDQRILNDRGHAIHLVYDEGGHRVGPYLLYAIESDKASFLIIEIYPETNKSVKLIEEINDEFQKYRDENSRFTYKNKINKTI